MRLKIPNLIPGQQYAIQVRSDDGKSVSAWSKKFMITTVIDDTIPNTPANVTWTVVGGTFKAAWDEVTHKVNGKEIRNLKTYQVRITDGTKDVHYKTSDTHFEFTQRKNKSVFGGKGATSLGFQVRAIDQKDNKSQYSEILWADNAAPEPPTIDSAVGIENGVELKWTSGDVDTVGYKVYVSTDPNFEPNELNLVWSGDATSYTYYTGTYQMHYFAVTAVDDYGLESEPAFAEAEPISPFIYDDVAPDVPGSVTAERNTSDATEIIVKWGTLGEDEGRAGFNVQYIKSGTYLYNESNPPTDTSVNPEWRWAGAGMQDAPGDATSSIITNIDPYEEYYVRVRAYDTYANYSSWSSFAIVGAETNWPPVAVTIDQIVTSEGATIISWSTTDKDIIQYEIQVDTLSTFDSPFVRNYTSVIPEKTIYDLDPNTVYFVRIKAIDAGRTSVEIDSFPWSNETQFTAAGPSDGAAPASAPVISVSGETLGQLVVSWNDVDNADPVMYRVYSGNVTGFSADETTLIGQTPLNEFVLRPPLPLDFSQTYYFKVIAEDTDGDSPVSNEASAQLKKIPGGHITTGTLSAAIITLGSGGEIRSSNYSSTTGFLLNDSSLIINNGTVSAGTLKGGTISGTTINIGSGGVLNVSDTAQIKSSNYASGSAGYKLDASGLEINQGSVSANTITGGTFDAGIIYVSSGGGIYDANGYWSITPSSINIQNGSINAGTITSGSLRSTQPARDANGVAITGQYAWQIDMQGDAILGNAYVRGRMIVGQSSVASSGVIQSYNYSPGSVGWSIDSAGNAEFNDATLRGTFRSGTANSSVVISQANDIQLYSYMGETSPAKVTAKASASYASLGMIAPAVSGNTTPKIVIENPAGFGLGYTTITGNLTLNHSLETYGFASFRGGARYYDTVDFERMITAIGGGDKAINAFGSIDLNGNNLLGCKQISNTSYGGYVDFDVNGGLLRLDGGSNYLGKISGPYGDCAVIWQGNHVVIGGPDFAASSPNSSNTRDLYMHTLHKWTTDVTESDIRIKQDISEVENASDIIRNIKIKKYRLRESKDSDKYQFGVIAQDLVEILPELVGQSEGTGMLNVGYEGLWAHTTAAVREIIEEKEALESRVTELERLVNQLLTTS